METIKINVNVEVGLKQDTIEALAAVFGPLAGSRSEAVGFDAPKKHKPQPKTEAQPAQAQDDDLPPDDAPAPKKNTPSEDDARKAVKAARDRGVTAKVIKDYMKEEFGIASSVECPTERRQELIDGLNKLAA